MTALSQASRGSGQQGSLFGSAHWQYLVGPVHVKYG